MPFPPDDYTPYGYLGTPTHTRNLTPRGVLRSWEAGFRWHFPAYARRYGGLREIYRAGLRVSVDGAVALGDYTRASSPYHSKNLFTFELDRGEAHVTATFHAIGEHALRASVQATGAARLALGVEYVRQLAARGEWGESGLVARAAGDALVLQAFEDGEAFALWTSRAPRDRGVSADEAQALAWAGGGAPGLPENGFLTVLGNMGEVVGLFATLGFDAGAPLDAILARGTTARAALEHLAAAREQAEAERARLQAEDDAFWARAPRLEGDWPEHWRRGLVYDVETLRMMVKQPVGIYRHVWDAMQIQAPRMVLAETAIDALLLSYADPAPAQALLAGAFLDAPEPNVPCSREDGSYNMVAADGTACGTAPSWGYPWLALDWLLALRPDHAWLAELYPALAAYLDWWLAERRDADGWLVYACSWEAGQDDSPRFGAQPLGGGHPVRHVRPVDLQAACAHAAGVMARLARALRREDEAARWGALAGEFAARTAQLWNGARYADFDARAGAFTGVDDVMLLAPWALGVALPSRFAGGNEGGPRPALCVPRSADDLTWPMQIWTAVEAALAAGETDTAAELAHAVCERAYGFWDARAPREGGGLPGVACEYWPLDGRCGGEGYGWGAFSVHLALHVLLGFTPAREGLALRPNLPRAWRVAGRRYGAQVQWRGRMLALALEPLDAERVRVWVDGEAHECAWGDVLWLETTA
jgi:hypothetical protein